MAKRGRPRHPDILTPREWEVLALLRDGLSNEQIARRLDITERTAKFHVSEILSKLGVSTRQEAASWWPEERRAWWALLGAPVSALRRASFGWAPAALVSALVIAVGVGVGLLVWGLARTEGEGRAGPDNTVLSNTPAAVSSEAFANGVPTTLLYTANGLRPIDPATAEDLPGYNAIITQGRPLAVSPDGRTAAVVMWQNGQDAARLKLFDLARWEWTDVASWQPGDLEVAGDVRELRWSPDGQRLFVRADEECVTSLEGSERCKSTLVTLNANSGKALHRTVLPPALALPELGGPTGRENTATFVPAADGSLVYLLGGSEANPSKARLVALDPAPGALTKELELPDVLLGARPEADNPGSVTHYVPAFAAARDGRRAYIVHADADRVTVVDLQAMRVERASTVGKAASLFDKALSLFADKVHADGRSPFSEKWATISPDGRYLYVGGGRALREPGDPRGVGAYPDASAGLQVIDTESLEIVKEIEPGGECEYRDLAAHPSGRYLYAFAGGTDPALTGIPRCGEGGLLVLDAATLETVARRSFVNSVAVAPAATSGQAGR